MKNIGLYIPNLSVGGAERVVSRLSYILGEEYKVFIFLNEDLVKYETHSEIINLDIPAERNYIKKLLLPFRRAFKLRKYKRIYQISCMISFLTSANIVNALSNTRETSTVLSVRNFSELEKKKSIFSQFENFIVKKLYRKADVIVPVSLTLEKSLATEYKIPLHKIETIYNPYDSNELVSMANRPIQNVEHERFLSSGKIFITIGRLTYQKGYWHLIKAFSMLPKESNSKLVILGTGPDQEKMIRLIKDLQLEERVLLAGYQQNPFQYFAKSYAYVLSSLFEGFPNGMVEAMVCKCPVIAADCKSGPREILFDNVSLDGQIDQLTIADYGIVVPPHSFKENWDAALFDESQEILASAMNSLIDNQSLRDSLSVKSQIRSKSYNYNECRNRYKKVIEKIG